MRLVLALLLVAAIAQAAPYQVGQSAIEMVRAERLAITDRFISTATQTAIALVDAPAAGPAEIGEVPATGSTGVRAGSWAYTVELRERLPDSVPGGEFDVTLVAGDRSAGTVRIRQDAPNPRVSESARATFDIGAELPPSSIFVVTVREVRVVIQQPLVSAVNGDLDYVWRASATASEDNPTITLASSEELLLLVSNGDGTTRHNVQVLDGSEPPPESADVEDLGDETRMSWVPPRAGSYVYQCEYHRQSMIGRIEVTAG